MPMSKLTLPSVLLATLAACGSGGGGGGTPGSVAGLQAPQQVTIVEASGSTPSTLKLPSSTYALAGSDYETDPTQFWIEDDSMRALDTVNMILSSLRQTRYWEETNNGPYRALIEDEQRGGGGERGNDAPEYEEWVVESTRSSNTAPQVVKAWIAQDETMGQQIASIIYARLTVTEEPSDDNPIGQFTLYFKNLAASADPASTDTGFEGYMRTVARGDNQSELEFHMSHGDVDATPASGQFAMRDRVHVIGDPASDAGRAYTESRAKFNFGPSVITEEAEYQIQFNANYLARRDVINANALSVLDRNDFTTRVYRYGLYDNTSEDRIDRLSGFPVETEQGRNGWAGYHGVWFPPDVTLTDGQTLLRRSFATNGTTPYTLFLANGRLEKRTRSEISLGDLIDEVIENFDPNTGAEQRVVWTGQDLTRVGLRSNGQWQPVDPPVSIASSYSAGEWLNFWSQARGNVELTWPATPSNTTPVFVWTSTTINADSEEMTSGDLTLHGYFHMLRANITANQANYQNAENPYFPDATAVNSGNKVYSFDKETLLLQLDGDPVTLATGVSITQGPAQFGLNCGPLFATALTSLAEVQNQTTSYEWRTGANNWNKLQALKDRSNNFVQFDPPLRLTYQHSETGSPFNGRTFFLEWDGTHLGGIPHQENTNSGNWYPLFNIPSGTTVTSGATTYKIKQLEGEQFMVAVPNPTAVYTAQGFDLDGTPITAPSATPYQDPNIGALPTVTSAPRYVGGVLQTSDN